MLAPFLCKSRCLPHILFLLPGPHPGWPARLERASVGGGRAGKPAKGTRLGPRHTGIAESPHPTSSLTALPLFVQTLLLSMLSVPSISPWPPWASVTCLSLAQGPAQAGAQ